MLVQLPFGPWVSAEEVLSICVEENNVLVRMIDAFQFTNKRESHEDAMRVRDECGKVVAQAIWDAPS